MSGAEVWTIARVLRWAIEDFKARGIESPRLDAELLLGEVLGLDRIRLITDAQRPLTAGELERFRAMIVRRRALEPVAYLLGRREFYGRIFQVNPGVLIPRPDTEVLLEVALRRTERWSMHGRALDLCTGSGCVAISFSRERPTWRVTGADLSPEALEVARLNARRLGAVWNVDWLEGDLFAPLPAGATFELITANPPYIPEEEVATLEPTVRDFEPHLALSGGQDGFDVTRRLIAEAPRFLAPGGVLALEIMAATGDAVAEMMRAAGFQSVEVARDYGGQERVVSGQR
jgi:release factor glutamine methyltransferase